MAASKQSSKTKTVRFTQVVERAGQPRAHTLWLAPDKDPELKRALAAQRVMTVETPGESGQTDVGFVGFDPKRKNPAQILIFPQSLARFAGARVVGIKFDLIEQPKLGAPQKLKRAARPRRAKHPPKRLPALAKFELPPRSKPVPHKQPSPESNVVPMPSQSAAKAPPQKSASANAPHALTREVRAALKDLEAGQAVVAYRRLKQALQQHDSD